MDVNGIWTGANFDPAGGIRPYGTPPFSMGASCLLLLRLAYCEPTRGDLHVRVCRHLGGRRSWDDGGELFF